MWTRFMADRFSSGLEGLDPRSKAAGRMASCRAAEA
jgi:hypothetical protein